MRVLKRVPYYPPHVGWLESHIAEWSHARVQAGCGQVCIFTSSPGQTSPHRSPEPGIDVYSYPTREIIPGYPVPRFWTWGFWRVWRIGREWKPDMVHTHTRFFLSTIAGGLFAWRCKKPWIHMEHGVAYVKLWSRALTTCAWIYDQIFGRRAFRYADLVVGISGWCKRFVQRFTSRDIPVIRRGMALDGSMLDRVWEKKQSRYAQSVDTHADLPIQVWFVWRLVALKWVALLIEAIGKLREAGYNVSCQIVGDGDARAWLESQVAQAGLGEYITFLWSMERNTIMQDILPSIDIIVNPSFQEGLPTSVLEWLLTWCVVVATDVGWTPEISDEADLILVHPGDVNSLQQWLQRAIEQYENIRGRSRLSVRERFSWGRAIAEYFTLFTK